MSNSTRPSSSSTSSSSGYDERFVVPLEASRRGAHRARVSPVMAALPVAVVIGIVVGAIVLVYWFLGGGQSNVGDGATTAAGPSTSAPAAPAPSGSAATDPTDSPSSALAPGTVDKSITVDVYNATSPNVSGLARRAANKLIAAGWTAGKVGTWTNGPVTQTTIFYASPDQKATAQALAKALGRGVPRLSPAKAADGIAVVVANDFPGAGVRTAPTTRTSRSITQGASTTAATDTTSATGTTSGTASTTTTTKSKTASSSTAASSASPSPATN